MMKQTIAAVALLLGAQSASAATTTIDFESFAAGDIVATVGVVTFSAGLGELPVVYDFGGLYANSGTKTLGTISGFVYDIFLDFSTPVSNLSFYSGGDDVAGQQATINIYHGGGLFDQVALMGDGVLDPDFQNLTGYIDVTRLEIVKITDPAGLTYDDFSFDVGAQVAPVPLPAAAPLLLAGLGGLVALRRRKSA